VITKAGPTLSYRTRHEHMDVLSHGLTAYREVYGTRPKRQTRGKRSLRVFLLSVAP
jgi:hypothetical protein